MNRTTRFSLTMLLTTALAVPLAFAEQTATQQLAEIVSQLNHRPSSSDQETLQAISEKGSEAEQAIAKALMAMDHKVSSSDKEKLRMVSKDRSVPESTRELANIVQNMNHKVSSKEKMLLQGM